MLNTGSSLPALDYPSMDEASLVRQVRAGDQEAFRQIMRRCNQRLFRAARGVTGDDTEAEDVVQEAYLHAYEKIGSYRGDASLITWLIRIVMNGAYARLRRRQRRVDTGHIESSQAAGDVVVPFPMKFGSEDPSSLAARDEIRRLLEGAIDRLPEAFRVVFVMREIECCSVEETAAALQLRGETVKTRLHRARRLLRTALRETLATTLTETFPFLGPRCDRIIARVSASIQRLPPVEPSPSLQNPVPPRIT